MQLSVIESNVTILKQHYVSSNRMEVWLPEAKFKTSWIENLGDIISADLYILYMDETF